MTRFIAAALALALWLSASLPALASCVPPVLADEVARADVIAFGTLSHSPLPFTSRRQADFEIVRLFKGGPVPSRVSVALGPDVKGGGPFTSGATSVDYVAEDGPHTLYLRRAGDGFTTDACSGSHPGSPTSEETAFLGAGGLSIVYDHPPQTWAIPVAIGALTLAVLVAAVLLLRRRALRPT